MGTMSAGAYLRVLRDHHGLTRDQLAEKLGVSDVTIWGIEDGRQEPKGGLLVAFLEAVRGSYDDIRRLILDPNATAEDGRRLAEARYKALDIDQVDADIDGLPQDEAMRLADKIMNDPEFLEDFVRSVAARGRRKV